MQSVEMAPMEANLRRLVTYKTIGPIIRATEEMGADEARSALRVLAFQLTCLHQELERIGVELVYPKPRERGRGFPEGVARARS